MLGKWKKIALIAAKSFTEMSLPIRDFITSRDVLETAEEMVEDELVEITPSRSAACQTLSKLWQMQLMTKEMVDGIARYKLTESGRIVCDAVWENLLTMGSITNAETIRLTIILNRLTENEPDEPVMLGSSPRTSRNSTATSRNRKPNMSSYEILKTYKQARKEKIKELENDNT